MRLHQIRDFVSALESGSLRGAARRLGISQPAMTKSIRNLEAELRVQLVQRTTRGVVPTRAGRAFLARARVIQTELRKAGEELAQLSGGRGGEVALGISPVAGILLMPSALARFRQEQPAAQVRIVEGWPAALLPLVRDETLDLAVMQKPVAKLDAALKYRPLLRTQLVVAGRRGHPLRGARSLRELAHAQWVIFRAPGQRGVLEEAFAAEGLPFPPPIVQCESYSIALVLLANTDTLGLIAPQFLDEPFVRGSIEEIALDTPLPPLVMGMYTRVDAPLTPIAAAMARAVTTASRRSTR